MEQTSEDQEPYIQPMSPYEREKVKGLIKLKEYIENTDETFSLHKIGQELGLSTLDLSTMTKMEMLIKTRSKASHVKFCYKWNTGIPSRELYRLIAETGKEYHREVSKKSSWKRKQKERRLMEQNRSLREAKSSKVKASKLKSRKSEGKIFDEGDTNFTNTLKANSEGFTDEKIKALASEYLPDYKNQFNEESMPITVVVTTEQNYKKVTINIEL
jgi:hypothetical protein